MLIASHCVGCRPYCPVGAIVTAPDGRHSTVDQDKCVECGACLRAVVCPVNAVVRPELTYPRTLCSVFSDVTSPHKSTGVIGRGTEEMKTNDVTGRLQAYRVNVSVELGRPGITVNLSLGVFGKTEKLPAEPSVSSKNSSPTSKKVGRRPNLRRRKSRRAAAAAFSIGNGPPASWPVLLTIRRNPYDYSSPKTP